MSVGNVDFPGSFATKYPSGSYDPRRPICPAGHVKSEVGIATNRQCRACRRKQQRHQSRFVQVLRDFNRRVNAALGADREAGEL